MDIGNRIREYREQCGYSQKELADQVYVSERTIGHYETGTRTVSIETLKKIAKALYVETIDLIEETKKTEEDWMEYLCENSVMARQNMDERRFRLISLRCFYDEEIVETEENLSCDGYVYCKSLGKELLALSCERFVFKEIWQTPDGVWKISGFLHQETFELSLKIEEEKQQARLSFTCYGAVNDENFALEYQNVIKMVSDWFRTDEPGFSLTYNVNAMLYRNETTEEQLLKATVSNGDFSQRIMNALTHYPEFQTVEGLLRASEAILNSIHQLSYQSRLEIQWFREEINRWLKKRRYVSKLKTNAPVPFSYLDKKQLPIDQTELSQSIIRTLKREGWVTLGDVCDLTYLQLTAIYQIDDKEGKQIQHELKKHGLSLRV